MVDENDTTGPSKAPYHLNVNVAAAAAGRGSLLITSAGFAVRFPRPACSAGQGPKSRSPTIEVNVNPVGRP